MKDICEMKKKLKSLFTMFAKNQMHGSFYFFFGFSQFQQNLLKFIYRPDLISFTNNLIIFKTWHFNPLTLVVFAGSHFDTLISYIGFWMSVQPVSVHFFAVIVFADDFINFSPITTCLL